MCNMISAHTSRIELEMNLGWARQYPHLFVDAITSFGEQARKHNLPLMRTDMSRDGFIVIIADQDQ